ncbi:TPA: phage tail protein [Escherichia coli]
MSASPVVKTGEEAKYHLIQKNISKVGLGEGSALPVGAPVPWPSETPPTGWMKCNGAVFSAEEYPELAKAYPTNKLPDLRGEFIRGWDDGRDVDSGRALLSEQLDAMQNVTGSLIDNTMGSASSASGVFNVGSSSGVKYAAPSTGNAFSYYGVTLDLSRSARTSAETRPRNIAFNYIVRAA